MTWSAGRLYYKIISYIVTWVRVDYIIRPRLKVQSFYYCGPGQDLTTPLPLRPSLFADPIPLDMVLVHGVVPHFHRTAAVVNAHLFGQPPLFSSSSADQSFDQGDVMAAAAALKPAGDLSDFGAR